MVNKNRLSSYRICLHLNFYFLDDDGGRLLFDYQTAISEKKIMLSV